MHEKKITTDKKVKDKSYPSAYFMSLTLENIRCFGEKQTLDLSDGKGRPAPWTVILGDNGVGKTTLLQCLVALEPANFSYESKLAGERIEHWIPRYSVFINKVINLYLTIKKSVDSARISSDLCYGSKIGSKGKYKVISDFNLQLVSRSKLIISDFPVGFSGREEPLGGLIIYGYGASRRMGSTSLKSNGYDDSTASMLSDDVSLLNAEEWLVQTNYKVKNSSGELRKLLNKNLSKTIKVLVDILPDIDEIKIPSISDADQKIGVLFKTKYGWVSLNDLSLGYRTMIAWMVDFAARMYERYPDSKDPLAEPAVVLVDEIDLHMHPKWQRKIMSYLTKRFPNTQFIVTAHSPLIVQAASDANIVLLKREGDHVIIENDPEIVKGWRVDQILMSDLYGLESSRSPEIQKLLDERAAILTKPKLTKTDIKKVEKLEAEIGYLPTGETREDIEARNIIREAAAQLKKVKG